MITALIFLYRICHLLTTHLIQDFTKCVLLFHDVIKVVLRLLSHSVFLICLCYRLVWLVHLWFIGVLDWLRQEYLRKMTFCCNRMLAWRCLFLDLILAISNVFFRVKIVVLLVEAWRSLKLRVILVILLTVVQFIVNSRVKKIGQRFSALATLRLECHLLQQILHVLRLEEVGRCRGSIAEHTEWTLAISCE